MLQQYLAELKKMELLSREEERRLWEEEAAGSETAHQKLMAAYQPLVFKTAMAFRLPEDITMELIQEGMVGLLEAAERYDYRKGVAFSLFAVHRIRGSMCDFLSRQSRNDTLSLDWMPEGGCSLAEFLPDEDNPRPEEIAERNMVSEKVTGAMDRLPAREKQVVEGIFLRNRTVAEMAGDINVTTNHVYRLEKQGVRRIRGMLSRFISEFRKG